MSLDYDTNAAKIPQGTVDTQRNGEADAVDEFPKFDDGDMTPFRIDSGNRSYVPIDGIKTSTMADDEGCKAASEERVAVTNSPVNGGVVMTETSPVNRALGEFRGREYGLLRGPNVPPGPKFGGLRDSRPQLRN